MSDDFPPRFTEKDLGNNDNKDTPPTIDGKVGIFEFQRQNANDADRCRMLVQKLW
jgi:hypothetical protein